MESKERVVEHLDNTILRPLALSCRRCWRELVHFLELLLYCLHGMGGWRSGKMPMFIKVAIGWEAARCIIVVSATW